MTDVIETGTLTVNGAAEPLSAAQLKERLERLAVAFPAEPKPGQ